jgi:hypothetical protein
MILIPKNVGSQDHLRAALPRNCLKTREQPLFGAVFVPQKTGVTTVAG